MTSLLRKTLAEFLGTLILVVFAVGAAVLGLKPAAGTSDSVAAATLVPLGVVGVALAFGLTLMVLAYAIGPVSGCHVNPAVTLGVLLRKGMTVQEAGYYWAAQFAGGIVGSAILQLLLSGGKMRDTTGGKGANDWGTNSNAFGAFLLEVLLTFLLVFVVLMVTAKFNQHAGFAGLAIGFTLVVVHLVGIPIDGTSVNPARSLGPALFEGHSPLAHVWLFILAPLVGGALAAFVIPLLSVPAAAPDSGAKRDQSDAGVPGNSRPRPNQTRPGSKPRR